MRLFRFMLPRQRDLARQPREVPASPRANTRRGQRVLARMPVLIYGRLANEPFSENTQTINVSSVGGLVSIEARVAVSQKLIVTNLQTDEDLLCRVARFGRGKDGHNLVGLEFLKPAPRFWHIDFVAAGEEYRR